MLIGLMRFLVRFVEIKDENIFTWFFICFSKKKNMKFWLTWFFFHVILHWSKSIMKNVRESILSNVDNIFNSKPRETKFKLA